MSQLTQHYYHVYNRAVAGERLFLSSENYEFLLRKIKQYLPGNVLAFIAYCLMPTHYHFLIRSEEDGELSAFIQRLFNSYAQAFNKQQNRRGKLFEKKPKNLLVETDEYVLQLARYIHLNPVRANLVKDPEDWQYSNYLEWVGARVGSLVDHDFVAQYFPDARSYQKFVLEGMLHPSEGLKPSEG